MTDRIEQLRAEQKKRLAAVEDGRREQTTFEAGAEVALTEALDIAESPTREALIKAQGIIAYDIRDLHLEANVILSQRAETQARLLEEARELLLDVSGALDNEDERYKRVVELSVRLMDWSK